MGDSIKEGTVSSWQKTKDATQKAGVYMAPVGDKIKVGAAAASVYMAPAAAKTKAGLTEVSNSINTTIEANPTMAAAKTKTYEGVK